MTTGRPALARLALASLCAVLAVSEPVAAKAQVIRVKPADEKNIGFLGFAWTQEAVLGPDSDSPIQPVITRVTSVNKCSPAEKAGLRVGDELMIVDERDARQPGYIFEDSNTGAGTVHIFTVRRGEDVIELSMTRTEPLGKNERPADRCEEGRPFPS